MDFGYFCPCQMQAQKKFCKTPEVSVMSSMGHKRAGKWVQFYVQIMSLL